MFDIGFTELLLVAVVGLIVVGPEKLPSTLRTGMGYFRQFKRSVSNIRHEVERELALDEWHDEFDEEKTQLRQSLGYDELQESFDSLKHETSAISAIKEDFEHWDSDNDGEISDADIEADLAELANEVGPKLPSGDAEAGTGIEVEPIESVDSAETKVNDA